MCYTEDDYFVRENVLCFMGVFIFIMFIVLMGYGVLETYTDYVYSHTRYRIDELLEQISIRDSRADTNEDNITDVNERSSYKRKIMVGFLKEHKLRVVEDSGYMFDSKGKEVSFFTAVGLFSDYYDKTTEVLK